MFPLADDNPRHSPPVLTIAIIGLCVVVFLYQLTLDEHELVALVTRYGFVPIYALGLSPPAHAGDAPGAEITIFTSMFLHGSLLHIGGNMMFLWIFGDNIEDALGRVRFAIFYLVCGAAAALAQAATDSHSFVPMIGASGAISGVMAAYLRLFPNAPVRVLFWVGFMAFSRRVPALFVIGLWFILQLISAAMSLGMPSGVAFWAHVGGFVAGLILTPLLLPRSFDRRS